MTKRKYLKEVIQQIKPDHYWTKEELRSFEKQNDWAKQFDSFWVRFFHPRLYNWYRNRNSNLNQAFFLQEQKRCRSVLEHVKGYALDSQQQRAVLTDEQNNLVLAGAGSGKSLTILGKIKYLLECRGFAREEILVITFTKAATKSLQSSLEQELGGTFPVYTFHQLALLLLKEAHLKKSLVEDSFLDQIVEELFAAWQKNDWFSIELRKYFLCYQNFTIHDSTQIKAFQEEQFLLQYFLLKGIRCRQKTIKTSTLHFSTLFLSVAGLYVQFYPQVPNYLEQVEQIRIYHETHHHRFFELFPNDFLKNQLEERLHQLFHTFSLIPNEQAILDFPIEFRSFQRLKGIILTFLHLMKANDLHAVSLEQWIIENEKEPHDVVRNRQAFLLKMIRECYYWYQYQLVEQQKMDFNDLIGEAITLIQKEGVSTPYRYLIVDEYQDTSYTRYLLLKSIQEATGAKLMAVGDDWQSIYRFTGCNLDIFLNFEQYFGDTEVLKIETTYRNSQQLIEVAGQFVMKNPAQKKKQLRSEKSISRPIHWMVYQKTPLECLPFLFSQIEQTGGKTVFLLGRTNRDLKALEQASFGHVKQGQFFYENASLQIFLHTIHTSKGLEADAVIILNLEDQLLGFPSQLHDDPIFHYLSQKEYYPFEEERRLFYVALTRTKGICYCLIPKKNPSCFWKELLKNHSKYLKEEKL